MPPVQNNQPGTGFGSRGKSVGLGPSVTPLGWLSAPRMNARGAIWAHIQIVFLVPCATLLFLVMIITHTRAHLCTHTHSRRQALERCAKAGAWIQFLACGQYVPEANNMLKECPSCRPMALVLSQCWNDTSSSRKG